MQRPKLDPTPKGPQKAVRGLQPEREVRNGERFCIGNCNDLGGRGWYWETVRGGRLSTLGVVPVFSSPNNWVQKPDIVEEGVREHMICILGVGCGMMVDMRKVRKAG